MDEPESWMCTVVRAHGLRFMRPEKSWRPIVIVELDNHPQHETVLGSDGQNINLKDSFHLPDATFTSRVEIKVFHRSQSKKKGKKRNLVGSVSCSLGDMWKKHGKEPKLELRLQCQNPTNRSVASRGRPQNGALIHLRLHPPASVASRPSPTASEDGYCSTSSRSPSPSTDSETLGPPSIIEQGPSQRIRKRRRVRGYCVNSDDEPESYSEEYSDDEDDTKPLLGGPFSLDNDDEPEYPQPPIQVSFNPVGWLVASILPQHTKELDKDLELNILERAITSFTVYREMKYAAVRDSDEEFDAVFGRLKSEWKYNAGILATLASVDMTILSISPDSLFAILPLERGTVAVSCIASGLGIACVFWFLVRYTWADLTTFKIRAQDILSTDTPSYFFFALSSRVPTILTLTSAISLMCFLLFIAFSAWPVAVIVACFLVGLLMGLQFLVFGILWVWRSARKLLRSMSRLVSRGTGVAEVEEKH
ncbi:hypothetical protein DFH07DRAFT_840687 [Mycena maculata]|uniref:C2 domain-containing protein n=1 Tax=Mycena maculata TaxID=230809 RepID=A0AAD7N0P6_9AGAR|nr:hypothetical protein DFH07DRAFT_840687 [Mycena maculata]